MSGSHSGRDSSSSSSSSPARDHECDSVEVNGGMLMEKSAACTHCRLLAAERQSEEKMAEEIEEGKRMKGMC